MMGMQATPDRLFYDFCLEDWVPGDHLLRRIDRFLDLAELRARPSPCYSTIGRLSINPEQMFRMLIVGYRFAIRSERRLTHHVHIQEMNGDSFRLRQSRKTNPDHTPINATPNWPAASAP